MRTMLVVALLASGCAIQAHSSRGLTRAEYQGAMHVVFTNASPVKMCELRMSSDAQPEYGDNWLPEGGLASGASLDLHVRPGTYKAMWSTCPTKSADGYYAATLWHDTAVEISRDIQLYAYVAERAAPTKRAPLRGVDFVLVRFQGQAIGPIAAQAAHPARSGDSSTPASELASSTEQRPAHSLGAADFIDPAATKKSHHLSRPSLGRTHDVTDGGVAYHSR